MTFDRNPLLTDLYQLSMLDAYLQEGMGATAVFEMFFRRLPPARSFLVAAGLEQAVTFLESLAFERAEVDALRKLNLFSSDLLALLESFAFTGDVDAIPEGRIVFADEPVLRITAPMPQAQFVESRLLNLIHFQTLVASKAVRCRLAAQSKQLIDFGFRRAHGAEAGVFAARASYLAGFEGTATVAAGVEFGLPLHGTMAHSYVEAHESELESFREFARVRRRNLVLLIDTYDIERAAARVVRLAPDLARDGLFISALRIDSGDLLQSSRAVREILNRGGLSGTRILVSGNLDEWAIAKLEAACAPIDAYGVGTSLTTSSDHPALDCAYKLQEYAGKPRRKRSEGKATFPGRKQVWRLRERGHLAGDIIGLEGETQAGEPLLVPVMRAGRRISPAPSLLASRQVLDREISELPDNLRALNGGDYPVSFSRAVRDLAVHADLSRKD